MAARSLVARASRPVLRRMAAAWPPHSRLFLVGEGAGWSIDRDMNALAAIAARLGVPTPHPRLRSAARDQCVFFGSQFDLLRRDWTPPPHRLATAYFHGRPGTPGMPEFDACFEALRAHHDEIARVQVTHGEMHELVLSSGIDPAKVFRIPIGVDVSSFAPASAEERSRARAELGLPQAAFVVGSFVKDGVGWGDGLEPKAIKGPDALVAALARARERVPELVALLSGPARGYVERGLERAGVPYRYAGAVDHTELPRLYRAADACLIASRQEGGPKALLEAMASGVPVVSTRVGQATELLHDGANGRLVEVDDVEALAAALADVAAGQGAAFVGPARRTAEANAYEAQLPLWRAFLDGFVALP